LKNIPRRPAEPRYGANDKARRKVQLGVWRVGLGGSTVLARCRADVSILISSTPQRRRLERFVVWQHGGRLVLAKDLYHTVKTRKSPYRLPSRFAHSPDWMKLAQ